MFYIILRFGTANAPVANVIDVNVPLYVLSFILDSFQGLSEMILDCLPKSSRVKIVTDVS